MGIIVKRKKNRPSAGVTSRYTPLLKRVGREKDETGQAARYLGPKLRGLLPGHLDP